MKQPLSSVDVANGRVIVDLTGDGTDLRFQLEHEEAFQLHRQLAAALTMLGPRAEAEASPKDGHGK